MNFSGGHRGGQSADSASNVGSPGLEARLSALRTLIQFGPATEISGSDPMAHQTRGLFDSITHLSQLALAAFGQLEQQDNRRSTSSFSDRMSR
jgi:hypothetical protein